MMGFVCVGVSLIYNCLLLEADQSMQSLFAVVPQANTQVQFKRMFVLFSILYLRQT